MIAKYLEKKHRMGLFWDLTVFTLGLEDLETHGQDWDVGDQWLYYDFVQVKGAGGMEACMVALWLPEDKMKT